MFKSDRKAQSTLEYAVLIGVIVAGLVGMQMYVKTHYQGKLRESADSMGEQFSPDSTTGSVRTKTSTVSRDEVMSDGSQRTVISSQLTEKSGQETVGPTSQEKMW